MYMIYTATEKARPSRGTRQQLKNQVSVKESIKRRLNKNNAV